MMQTKPTANKNNEKNKGVNNGFHCATRCCERPVTIGAGDCMRRSRRSTVWTKANEKRSVAQKDR
jgi:hypothetical protein